MPDDEDFQATLKRAAAILTAAGIPFAVGGGFACWAYGAPESDHDVDLFLKEADAHRAQDALAAEGMRPVDPPEDWDDMRRRTESSPFARAFFTLVEGLGVIPYPMARTG